MSTNQPSSADQPPTHVEKETVPWRIRIPDHPERTDSKAFRAARRLAQRILATLHDYPYGPGPWQMHHGGSLWTFDDDGWFLVLNTLGSEWSAQFCADPAKVEAMRRNAARHYAGFPKTVPRMVAMGYPDAERILSTPIHDAGAASEFIDSVFNSCVPLAAPVHTGTVAAAHPLGGVHHYPKPIADIQFFKYDDFELWVTDAEGHEVAVAPASPRGSGDGRVEVIFATPGTKLHQLHRDAHAENRRLIVAADDPLARQAFAEQQG